MNTKEMLHFANNVYSISNDCPQLLDVAKELYEYVYLRWSNAEQRKQIKQRINMIHEKLKHQREKERVSL